MNKKLILLASLLMLTQLCCIKGSNKFTGIYVASEYSNSSDTIIVHENGIYNRRVYDQNGKNVLNMQGKWETDSEMSQIVFHSFFMNLDLDLVKFPDLVSDTVMIHSSTLRSDAGKTLFCIGYYQNENCFQKVSH